MSSFWVFFFIVYGSLLSHFYAKLSHQKETKFMASQAMTAITICSRDTVSFILLRLGYRGVIIGWDEVALTAITICSRDTVPFIVFRLGYRGVIIGWDEVALTIIAICSRDTLSFCSGLDTAESSLAGTRWPWLLLLSVPVTLSLSLCWGWDTAESSLAGTRVSPHFCFGSEIWNLSLEGEKKPDFTWFTSMRNTKNLMQKWR